MLIIFKHVNQQCFPCHYIRGRPGPSHFIFSIASDHNRSHLKLPFIYLVLLLHKLNSLMLFILFTRRHVISVSTLWSRSLYRAQRSSAPMRTQPRAHRHRHRHRHVHTHTHTHTQVSTLKSNQIKSLLLSHHHSTSALVSEILMSVLQTVQKNNRQFTYGQTVQKNQQTIYIWTDSAKKHNNSNLHMDRQCKKATAIYIWTVHIYRLYRRQCAKYTYIYSVHIVYYKDILNYQRHIIHRMGTSALCTVSIHNVVYA